MHILHACMCIMYMHVHVYVRIYTCTYIVYAYIHAHVHTYMHCIHIYLHVRMYTCIGVHIEPLTPHTMLHRSALKALPPLVLSPSSPDRPEFLSTPVVLEMENILKSLRYTCIRTYIHVHVRILILY